MDLTQANFRDIELIKKNGFNSSQFETVFCPSGINEVIVPAACRVTDLSSSLQPSASCFISVFP